MKNGELVTSDISKLSTKELGDAFASQVKLGVVAFQKAGAILVELVRRDPHVLLRLQKEQGIPIAVSNLFLKIGRGQLLPQLLSAPSFIRRLPISDQKLLVEGSVEALVMKADGSTDSVKVDILSSDPLIVKQVCGPAGIRTPAQQRQWLVAEANKGFAKKEVGDKQPSLAPWHAEGKKIVVTCGVTLTAKDLSTMLAAIS